MIPFRYELTEMSRKASIKRETAETQIELSLELDGTGQSDIQTGVGFFDHMLTLLARHALVRSDSQSER